MISKLLKKENKGFTLMEMLIVVAIIAVLIAIAIPTFTSSLNKARVATDEANIRSGYASVMAEVLANEEKYAQTAGTETYTFTLNTDGSVKLTAGTGVTAETTGTTYATKGNAEKVAGQGGKIEIAGQQVDAWETGETVTYVYTPANNTVVIHVDPANQGG